MCHKNLKKSDTWNIKLTTAINFISSKNANEEHLMHSSRDSIEIMPHDKAYEATVDCQYLELFGISSKCLLLFI